ncbi:hypothetical protein [Mycoplasma nasistruthionis]|uniref:Uncharacterized protein n=1 Tax=Mycoplasma nasistruthionis TaxID=353852 RepID=A0A4Y6I623_9MOLU|nr:hypothetical protein [Mycoplasma nasistruthionis]QDF64750.1 hypothetical protein FIV53_00205 [Mycoplasma nasistruthionis]
MLKKTKVNNRKRYLKNKKQNQLQIVKNALCVGGHKTVEDLAKQFKCSTRTVYLMIEKVKSSDFACDPNATYTPKTKIQKLSNKFTNPEVKGFVDNYHKINMQNYEKTGTLNLISLRNYYAIHLEPLHLFSYSTFVKWTNALGVITPYTTKRGLKNCKTSKQKKV